MPERSTAKHRFLLLVFALAPLIPLWRCVVYGESIGAFDQIRQFAPWLRPAPAQPWDGLQADSVLQFYPWRELVFRSWANGDLPFWNPYVLGGTPLLANSQSAALYPLHILAGLCDFPTGPAMVILAWLHLSWAGLGVYSLTRRYGGRRSGAILAGLTFSLSPFMISWTALPSVITTVSWIPWILACIVKSARAEDSRTRTLATIYTALSVGMMLLAGHLQFAAYGFIAAGVVICVETFGVKKLPGRRRRKSSAIHAEDEPAVVAPKAKRKFEFAFLARSVLALAVGVALAAPQLLPVLDYSQYSHRRGSATSDGYSAYIGAAIKPYALGTLPFATLNGDPGVYPTLADSDSNSVSAYWPQLDPPFMSFPESAIALGPLALALLFLAPWRQKRRGMLEMSLVGIVALLLALGTPLNALLYFGVPGWSATGSPGRIIVLFVLAASVVSGLAIGRLSAKKESLVHHILPIMLPAFLLVPCVLLTTADQNGPMASLIDTLSDAALQASIWGVLAALLISAMAIAAAYRLKPVRNRILLIASPVIICMLQGGFDLIRTGHPAFMKEPSINLSDPNERIAVINDPWSIQLAAPAIAPPNTLSVARIHVLDGYDSLVNKKTVDLLKDINGKDPAPPANGNMMFVKPTADPVKLGAAGVTEIWSLKPVPQFGEPYSVEHGIRRYHVASPGRASTEHGPAKIISESPTEIVVRATGPGTLTLRDTNMPGWTAKIEDSPTQIHGDLWRNVELPPGDQTVTFDYQPPGLYAGLGVAFLAIIGILALIIPIMIKTVKVATAPKTTESIE